MANLAQHGSERPSQRLCEDAARIPLTEEAVLGLLRQHFADANDIDVCPHVLPSKELAARRAYVAHLAPHERILALCDTSSVLDIEHVGFVVTATRICWKNPNEPACTLEWMDLDPNELFSDGSRLFLGREAIVLADHDLQDTCANAFHILALSGMGDADSVSQARPVRDTAPDIPVTTVTSESGVTAGAQKTSERRSATPPPPHTTSYVAYASHATTQAPECRCWRCTTPLYETTPQCAYCGAEPTGAGWLRAG